MMDNETIKRRGRLGAYLAGLREKAGVSKYEMKKRYGLRVETVNGIERGDIVYSVDSLLKYMEAIGAYIKAGRGGGAAGGRG